MEARQRVSLVIQNFDMETGVNWENMVTISDLQVTHCVKK